MYADSVTILGVGIRTVKLNTGTVIVASRETELETSADRTKHMVTSQDQNAARGHNIN